MFAIIYFSILAIIGLSLLSASLAAIFISFRYPEKLDRILPAFFVMAAGFLLLLGGIVNERDLKYANFGAVFVQADKSIWYFWSSRLISLLLVGLSVPYLFSKLLINIREKEAINWPAVVIVVFGITNFVMPGLFGTQPGVDHRLLYPILVMLVVAIGAAEKTDLVLRTIKSILVLYFILSLSFLAFEPGRVLAPDYAGFIPGFHSRFWGLANHANAMGPMATMAMFLEFYVTSRNRLVRMLVLGTSFTVLLLSQSKTSIGATLIGLLIMFYVRSGYKKHASDQTSAILLHPGQILLYLAVTGGSLFVLVAQMSGSIDLFHLGGTTMSASTTTESFTGRGVIWAAAYQEWLRNPLFGYGTNLWDEEYRRHIGMNYAFHAHNQFFQTLAESGLFGISGLFLFVFFTVIACIRASRKTLGVSLAVLALFLFRGMTEVPLRASGIGTGEMFFMVILICVWQLANTAKQPILVKES